MTAGQSTDWLERMMLIRAYEEALVSLQRKQAAPGTCTSVGQEASAVGVVSALGPDDRIITNHRSAGHLIARGAEPRRMMAEVMGKRDGYCGGKSGSLHISVAELGIVLTSTIVGGELGLAPGVALSRKMLGEPGVVACFFGDGAACQGRFHESLNLAAVWELPVLYVCENNQWQAFVHRRETMLTPSIAERGAAYGIEAVTVDGNDVEAVNHATQQAMRFIRETGRPYLLECSTYRLRGHYEPDDQAYVDPSELAYWRDRDPIKLLREKLERDGTLQPGGFEALQRSTFERIEAAVAYADANPYPGLDELTTHVYA